MILRHPRTALLVSFLAFWAAFAFCPFLGPGPLDLRSAFHASGSNQDSMILFFVRMPRIVLALMAGASLSIAGAIFQTVLRNPLAEPYTLGVAGGASLGAVASFALSLPSFYLGFPTVTLTAFAGALLSMGIVFGVSSAVKPLSTTSLILAGVTSNFLFNALILLLYYLSDFTQSAAMLHWLLGGLDASSPSSVPLLAGLLTPIILIILLLSRELDVLAAGAQMARSKGLNSGRSSFIFLTLASLLTGVVVAQTGPIGFVGLLVPHAIRPFTGPDHRILLPSAALMGGAFLAFCDAVSRTILSPAELPVGVLTALIGGPFFLLILARMKKPFSFD